MKSIETKSFIELLKRAVKSGYGKQVVLHNRMFLAVYDPDVDNDVGFHYTLFIPDTESYDSPFYDRTLILNPHEIIAAYNLYANELTELRKKAGLKPAEAVIVTRYRAEDDTITITFDYQLQGATQFESSVKISSQIDQNSYTIETLIKTYQKLTERIDSTFTTVVIDGLASDFIDIALKTIQIHYVKIKISDTETIKFPLIQSLLNGQKKFDDFIIAINKTLLDQIYTYTICYTVKGITECFVSYINIF